MDVDPATPVPVTAKAPAPWRRVVLAAAAVVSIVAIALVVLLPREHRETVACDTPIGSSLAEAGGRVEGSLCDVTVDGDGLDRPGGLVLRVAPDLRGSGAYGIAWLPFFTSSVDLSSVEVVAEFQFPPEGVRRTPGELHVQLTAQDTAMDYGDTDWDRGQVTRSAFEIRLSDGTVLGTGPINRQGVSAVGVKVGFDSAAPSDSRFTTPFTVVVRVVARF